MENSAGANSNFTTPVACAAYSVDIALLVKF